MNKIKEFYFGLEQREKIILPGGLFFLVVFILLNFFILPAINYKKNLENKISSYNYQADQIRLLGKEYKEILKNSNLSQSSNGSDVALFSFMDSLAGRAEIKDKVDYMKPSTQKSGGVTIEKVEIKVSDIDMKNLVRFLYLVESSSDAVIVKGLKISRSDKSGFITSTIQAETVKNNV
jgi:hypothetical protein